MLTPLQPRSRATGELQPTAIATRIYDWIKIYQSSPILNHLIPDLTYVLAKVYGRGGDWWRPGDGKVLHGETGQTSHVELLRREEKQELYVMQLSTNRACYQLKPEESQVRYEGFEDSQTFDVAYSHRAF